MMEDEEDLRKITAIIDNYKSSCQTNFQLEFQDFINFRQNEGEENTNDVGASSELEDIELKINRQCKDISQLQTYLPIDSLKEEERDTIETCNQTNLRQLMLLNRMKHMQLIKIYKKVKDLLIECQDNIRLKKNCIKQNESYFKSSQAPPTWKLAAPYFKDKRFFTSPHNADITIKRENKELSLYNLIPARRWSAIECSALIEAVQNNYNEKKMVDISKKINSLESKKGEPKELIKLQIELKELKGVNSCEVPPLGLDDCLDWYYIAESALKDKRTAAECKTFWNIYLHPDINKSNWTEEENNKIKTIATKYYLQNWDVIATELNTKRTAFTTCLHYHSNLAERFKKRKFSAEEDKLLLDVVDYHRIGKYVPWQKVVYYFDNRSRHQLYHRYSYFLSQTNVKRGKFTEAEDILLMILVEKFGKNFRLCSEYMPHRSLVQLKSRYNSNLMFELKKGTYTVEDDEAILEHVKEFGGKHWGQLSAKLNRGRAQIRQRYHCIKNFLGVNPESKLCDIPKRRHLYRMKYKFVKFMADQYKDADFIPTLKMIEECLEIKPQLQCTTNRVRNTNNNRKVEVKSIDTMLTDFFTTNPIIEKQSINNKAAINSKVLKENAKEIFNILGGNLDLPHDLENLDSIDKEILQFIADNNKPVPNAYGNKLIPPNISTLQGLDYLLRTHQSWVEVPEKDKLSILHFLPTTLNIEETKIMWSFEQYFTNLNEKDREIVENERELFLKRFSILFKWPSLLSLEEPNEFDSLLEENNSSLEVPRVIFDKKFIDELQFESPTKKKKVTSNLVQTKKANLIKKSVVKNSLKPKQSLNKRKSDAVGVKLKNHPNNEDDASDITKLDVLLKAEITSYSNKDNDKTIEDDVELLNEILIYDKKNFQHK